MFEQVVTRPRAGGRKTALIVASAIVHAVGIATLAVAAMWHVDKVAVAEVAPVIIQAPRLPAGNDSPPPGRRIDFPKPPRTRAPDITQPTQHPPIAEPTMGGGGPTATGGGGDPTAPPCEGAACDLPPCAEPPCEPAAEPDPPAPEPHEPPPVVEHHDPVTLPPTVAKGLRTSGDDQIFPARPVQLAMMHDGKDQVRGTFQVCVDEQGDVSGVRQLASTGYPDYDQDLIAAMRQWHYRPYEVGTNPADRHPTAMCTVQMFVYRIKP